MQPATASTTTPSCSPRSSVTAAARDGPREAEPAELGVLSRSTKDDGIRVSLFVDHSCRIEMKRHPALVPLSHDHHHALVEARRLRRAADAPDATTAATSFLRFFAEETVPHFREEEELLFPSIIEFEEPRELLVQALMEHQRLRALTARLQQLVTTGGEVEDVMRGIGDLLEAHVRLEERQLFPLIERLLEEVTEP